MLRWGNLLATAAGSVGVVGMQELSSGHIGIGVAFIVCGGFCFAASLALDK